MIAGWEVASSSSWKGKDEGVSSPSSREGRGGRDVVSLSSSSSSSRVSSSCVRDNLGKREGLGDRDDDCGRGGLVVEGGDAGGGTTLVVVVVVKLRW